MGNIPVSYGAFTVRLKKMDLHDAVYTPRAEYNVRDKTPKHPIQDEIRRRQINKEENIQVLDFHEVKKVEQRLQKGKKNKIQIPKPKKSLLDRFILLFTDKKSKND